VTENFYKERAACSSLGWANQQNKKMLGKKMKVKIFERIKACP